MKKLGKALLNLVAILCFLWELVEFLLLPAFFLVIGLWQQMPWQYYAITIGGYFALFFLGQLLLHLIFKRLDKKYSSRFAKKMEKIISKFSTEAD